jgi:twitching motility protein PilT
MSLMAVLSQTLLPALNGGRVLALEIMIPNRAIRTLIREDKVHQIYAAMQSGQESSGMQTMNQSLLNLVERRLIRPDIAMEKSGEPEELQELFVKRGIGSKANAGPSRPTMPLGNKRGV